MPSIKLSKIVVLITTALLLLGGAFFYKVILKRLYPVKYQDIIEEASITYDIESALIYSIINVESSFDRFAISNKNANGLMQITNSTAEYIANLKGIKEYDIFDAKTNIDFGVFYIRYLLDRFGSIETALIAYNAGEGRVKEWLNNKEYSKDGVFLQSIPYKETKEYLIKIEKGVKKYKKLYHYLLDK